MAEEPHGLRVAARSSSTELHAGWAWGLTAIAVLAGGMTLHAARSAIGTSLDRLLPRLERAVEEAPGEAPSVLPPPDPEIEQASEPEWTYVDIEASVRPLPERIGALIMEGRGEISEFIGLTSTDESRALLTRNRWRSWGRIWHNRVEHVGRSKPPAEVCDVHAALEPTCRAVRDSLGLLDEVPAASSVGEARELLDGAATILEQLRQSQAEPEEDSLSE